MIFKLQIQFQLPLDPIEIKLLTDIVEKRYGFSKDVLIWINWK